MPKVFVHGNPETDAIWGPLVEALAAREIDDVVLLSPPGFGAACPDSWDPTPANYVAWLAGELEQLGGDIDLVGHDCGALHTYALAAEHPELLRSWAADCAGLLHPDYVWHKTAQTWQQTGAGEEWVELTMSLPLDDRTNVWLGFGLPEDIAQSMAAGFNAEMGRCILGLYRAAVQPALVQLADRLAATEHKPALVINPTDDPFVGSALVPAVVERFGIQHLTLHGHGHWWMVHENGAAAGADGLVSFWNGL